MKNVLESDLQRLGISREEWDAHCERIEAECPFEVRCVGGMEPLREALVAAGLEFTITNLRRYESYQRVVDGYIGKHRREQ